MIEIIQTRQNKESQTAFFKLTVDGKIIEWHGNCPKNESSESYFEAMEDELIFMALYRMYPQAGWKAFYEDGNTRLEAIREWIAKGHKNKIQIGMTVAGNPKYAYKVIEKKEWKSSHPKSVRLLALIEASTVAPEMKNLLKEIVK